MNMEDKPVTLLVLLDLSAAFDTVDHRILFQVLHLIGLNRTSLIEPSVYLSMVFYRILSILNLEIHKHSCLGPVLFSLYASKLFKIVE